MHTTHATAESGQESPIIATTQVCKAAGDPLRANIVKLLAQDSFGVLELCELLQMAQPAMSHHLKCLLEAGLVEKRPEGTFVFYQRSTQTTPFIDTLFQSLDDEPLPVELQERITPIYAERAARSLKFFENNADALQQQRALVCQADVYAQAVLGSCQKLPEAARQQLLEVGPGDGALLAELARLYHHVRAIDTSATNLQSARSLTDELDNVELEHADFMALQGQHQFDTVVAAMVIHHLASPEQFFTKARTQLNSGGLLVVAELSAHQQHWVGDACGDIWLGFEPQQLIQWAQRAGFTSINLQHLAQRNGFNVQVHTFQLEADLTRTST